MIAIQFTHQIRPERSIKKVVPRELGIEAEDNLVVEEYEGECEECQKNVKEKVCPMCEA